MHVSEMSIGQLVMFANRTQICSTGMKVLEIDHDLFGTRVKIDAGPSHAWWVPKCFMPYEAWKASLAST